MKTIFAPRLTDSEPDAARKYLHAEPDTGGRNARLLGFRISVFRLGSVASLLTGLTCSASAATYTVTTTNDSGAGSLRAAILAANASPSADVIAFNLPGPGVHTITPLTELPAITKPVTLDGYTQPGSQANTLATGSDARLLIRLTSAAWPGLAYGLRLTGSGHTVRGLVIVQFGTGLSLDTCSQTTIAGNWIGLDVDNLASGQAFDGINLSCPS